MTLHILIPCKSLGDGKTRLAQALDAKARRALCTGFLQRTLDVALALVPPSRCHVMAGDGAAAAIAAARGVTSCDDPGIGLNEALRQGRDDLPQRCGRVRAADLPHRSAMGDGGRARRPGTLRRRRGHCAGPGADGDKRTLSWSAGGATVRLPVRRQQLRRTPERDRSWSAGRRL